MPEKKIRTSKRTSKKRSRKGERFLESDSTAENAGFFNLERADRKLLLTTVGIVILLVFAAHAITIWGEFVYLDLFNLTELRNTRDWNLFWSDLMLNSLVSPLNEPLVKVSLAIDVLSMGIRSPGVFHAINMLLHLANVLLLYFFVRRLGKHADLKTRLSLEPDLVAFASAAIFACHPLACGAISYISARSALLVVFNYLLSLHLFISGFLARDIKNALFLYLFSYLFVLFGIWSGPQAVTIPGAFIALALLLKPRKTTFKSWVMDRPFEFFAQLLVALAVPLVLLLNFNPLVGTGFGLSTLTLPQYVATQFKVLFTYTLRCFLVPYGLSLDPPFALAIEHGRPSISGRTGYGSYGGILRLSAPRLDYSILRPDFIRPFSHSKLLCAPSRICLDYSYLFHHGLPGNSIRLLSGSLFSSETDAGTSSGRGHSPYPDRALQLSKLAVAQRYSAVAICPLDESREQKKYLYVCLGS
ncbi:MAG: hypothetical protein R3F51_21680 [Cyanobacteriota/Melainabacteria group bacterium]